jgi:hypothetical protein
VSSDGLRPDVHARTNAMKSVSRRAHRSFAIGAVALAWLVVAPAAQAAPPPRLQVVAVFPPSGDNVAPDLLRAARDILKDHLQRAGTYSVVEPPVPATPPSTADEPTPMQAAQTAASLGAETAVVLRITQFGNSARIRLASYSAGTAQVVYWDSIVISGGPDEMDVAIQRLVHGMQMGKPVRESAELETVTERETQTLNRREANKSFGVHLFTLLPTSSAGSSFTAVPAGGIFWLYDARSWMADISLDIGGHNGTTLVDAAIGGYYPFLREDFTPYVGGVVRWADMNLGGQGASGLSLQPTAGILLGRLSSVQMRGEVGYFFNTFGELGPPDPTTGAVSTHTDYGQGFVISLGLGF